MRFSSLAAPVACSVLLHVVLLHAGWEVVSSSTRAATPWRNGGQLRVTLARAASPAETQVSSRASLTPYIPSGAPEVAPARRKPRALEPTPPAAVAPRPAAETQPEPAATPPVSALPDDSGFVDAGGVDEPARLLREPDFYLPNGQAVLNWQIHFDLLIDAQGKVVRVDNVSEGAPRDVIGAVLVAFYAAPFEPARLAGQPVAVRQRFEVGPDSTPPGASLGAGQGRGQGAARERGAGEVPVPGGSPVRIPLPVPGGARSGGEAAVMP
jgi:hypothetical protein